MSGCGAAYESRYWGRKLKIVVAEKGDIKRSGAVAMGLSAINCYMGMRWNENTPQDFVKYARTDLMGLVREDLVYDIARHVDSTVHLFEEWGLPIIYDSETGRYKREGRWQILIHGESYKPIVAEAAQKPPRRFTTGSWSRTSSRTPPTPTSSLEPLASTFGMGHSISSEQGGDHHGWRRHAHLQAEVGRRGCRQDMVLSLEHWFSIRALMRVGAEMTQMENKLVVTRFKDGYGPVGAWFLALKAVATNAYGENYELRYQEEQRALYGDYVDGKPFPTCLRNDAMLREIRAGRSPIFIHTERVLDTKEKEELGYEDFLDMTMSQTIVWASQNIDPKKRPSELQPSEPYVMGSHATCSGAWASGPADISPKEYFWGYNRMTTVEGLFGAGDTIGGSAHKFSSGSFTEGRSAGKAAVMYLMDHPDRRPEPAAGAIDELKKEVYRPFETYNRGRNLITRGTVSPTYFYADQGVVRLEKLMDEYVGGWGSFYTTNEVLLDRGMELLTMLREDMPHVAAENLHQLQRAWELHHRVWTAEAVLRHTLFRKETRWPGYCYRADYPKLDDKDWHVFVNSRYDPQTGEWKLFTRPCISLVPS